MIGDSCAVNSYKKVKGEMDKPNVMVLELGGGIGFAGFGPAAVTAAAYCLCRINEILFNVCRWIFQTRMTP